MLCATATPPKTFSEFTHKTQSTSNPLAVVVDEADRGKHCYFAVHWLTSTLKEGPWSEIFHVVIP
jgi:hypothetical protein